MDLGFITYDKLYTPGGSIPTFKDGKTNDQKKCDICVGPFFAVAAAADLGQTIMEKAMKTRLDELVLVTVNGWRKKSRMVHS